MNNDYLLRKQQELNILNSYLNKPFYIGKLNNVVQVLKIKNKIVDGIRTQSRNRFFHHLTNNNQISFKSKFFYNISSKYYSSTFFTNWGISAKTGNYRPKFEEQIRGILGTK